MSVITSREKQRYKKYKIHVRSVSEKSLLLQLLLLSVISFTVIFLFEVDILQLHLLSSPPVNTIIT